MNYVNKFILLSAGQVALLSLLLAGIYYVVLYDSGDKLNAQISASQQKTEELRSKSKVLDRDLDQIEKLKATQERDAERLKVLLDYIPEKLNSIALMQIVSNESKAIGVNINSLSADKAKSGGEFYEEIPIKINVSGSFVQILRLLAGMTRLEQIFSFANLELKRTGTATDPNGLTMSTVLTGYRYKGESKGPKK